MSKIALLTDSTACLPAAVLGQYDIRVIPLYVHYQDKTLVDGVDITPQEYVELLREAKVLPTTSQPSVGDFLSLYRDLAQKADVIISIHISSGLSGTVASAQGARQALAEEAAEEGMEPLEIHVVDSTVTSVGLELMVTAGARAIAAGQSVESVLQTFEDVRQRMKVIFVVDTLEYLHKGGRIGGASALMGSVLQIKPILHLSGGHIEVLDKVRTAKKAKERVWEILHQGLDAERPVHAAITHVDALEEAKKLEQRLKESFSCEELSISNLSPSIATHVGPGTVGVAFYSGL